MILVILCVCISSLFMISLTIRRALVLRGIGKLLLTATASLVGVVWIIIQKQSFFFIPLLFVAALAALCSWFLAPGRKEIGKQSIRVLFTLAVVGIVAMLLSLVANLAWGLGLLVSMSFVATMPILPQGSWLAAWIADGLLMTLSVAIVLLILIRNLIAAVSTEISLSI